MKKLTITLNALLLLTVLTACNQEEDKNAEKQETVTSVETATVTKGNMVIERSIYGRTAPTSTTPILLQVPGKIKTLEVENGDQVEEGDVIATFQTPKGTQTIYAETAGEMAQLQGAEGTSATIEKPLAVIVDLDQLKLQLTVTADATSLFELGKKYPVQIGDGTEIDAEITTIGTLPNETGLYSIEAKIPNDDYKFIPGTVAEMNVPETIIEDALIVPTEAVTQESGKSFVYIIENNKVIEKDINVIETKSDKTAIKGDVEKDVQVVTSGQLTLSDGAKVKIAEEG